MIYSIFVSTLIANSIKMKNYSCYSFLLIALLWLMPVQATASNLAGDANGDGVISIKDVTTIIDLILSGNNNPDADANQDGDVTIKDVTMLIDIILNGGSEETPVSTWPEDRPLKILVIGNSHSVDTWSYVPFILKNLGFDIILGICYRGGNPLYMQQLKSGYIQNWNSDIHDAIGRDPWRIEYFYYFDTRKHTSWQESTNVITYPEQTVLLTDNDLGLTDDDAMGLNGDWDFIAVQVAYHLENMTENALASETYLSDNGYVNQLSNNKVDVMFQLIDYSRQKAGLNSEYVKGFVFTPQTALNQGTSYKLEDIQINLPEGIVKLPAATSFYNLRANKTLREIESGAYVRNLFGDMLHLSEGLACYAAASTIVESLMREYNTGVHITSDTMSKDTWGDWYNNANIPQRQPPYYDPAYCPTGLDYLAEGRDAAIEACDNPYVLKKDRVKITYCFDPEVFELYINSESNSNRVVNGQIEEIDMYTSWNSDMINGQYHNLVIKSLTNAVPKIKFAIEWNGVESDVSNASCEIKDLTQTGDSVYTLLRNIAANNFYTLYSICTDIRITITEQIN